MRLEVLDLFSGIGGLSLGFDQAGFRCIAGVEQNEHHRAAFLRVHKGADVSFEDVAAVSRKSLNKLGAFPAELAVIVGGPPCQPFSLAGKRQGIDDSRGSLVGQFVRVVGELKPRAFVMENVQGLTSIHGGSLIEEVISDLRKHGYTVQWDVLNAADFGVPQVRRRLFVVGLLHGKRSFEFPKTTHTKRSDRPSLFEDPTQHVTVEQAISDLPQNGPGRRRTSIEDQDPIPYARSAQSEYQKEMRGSATTVTGNKLTIHFDRIREVLSELSEGEEEPATRYRRLYRDQPAFTLRAGSGSFTALRPIHPTQPRVITVREAARLQSFPDWVTFAPAKKWAYQEIGNSVPPLLGRAIAEKLRGYLE